MAKLLAITAIMSLISAISGCYVLTERTIEEELEENNYKFPWLVSVYYAEGNSVFSGIGWGSLLKMNTVLTSAKLIANYQVEDLQVVANCEVVYWETETDVSFCKAKDVEKIRFSPDFDPEDPKDEDWALLVLKEEFQETPGVKAVQIPDADAGNDLDLANCLVHHWTFMRSNETENTAFIVNSYRASLAEAEFGFTEEGLDSQLFRDVDCAIDECNVKQLHFNHSKDISFQGSPVSCPLKDDPLEFLQAGISTAVYRVHVTADGDPVSYELARGTLVDLTGKVEEIRRAMEG